jgi:ketosteroid isomerase-like protein
MEATSEIQKRNVELTRVGFEAYDAGDYGTLTELLNPDVEVHADSELINGGDFQGHQGFMRWNAQWIDAWGEFRNELRSVEAVGERFILAEVHQVARGAGSGVDVEMDVCWAIEVVGGQVRRMHIYVTRDRAISAIERWRAGRQNADT